MIATAKAKLSSTFLARPHEFPVWPSFGDDEVEAVARVLLSGKVNYWTGNEGRQFEAEFANFIGCKHTVAVANGTVALELALRALGVGPGDEVITSSRTFIASASSVVAVGARPVCADVDLNSGNITAETIQTVCTPATRAIIVVHLAGWPCDMDPILEFARTRNIRIIEDCAQAHGATYKGRRVGSLGDVGAFSFCQDKIITTAGEGGMVTTNDSELWEHMWSYKDHGKNYKSAHQKHEGSEFRWLHASFGTNWRLTELQSAVGRAQLRKLPEWLRVRRRHARTFEERLARVRGLRLPPVPEDTQHAYYKLYVYVVPGLLAPGWNRDRICEAIRQRSIPCGSGSCSEIYLEDAFPQAWRPAHPLPAARCLGERSLMFQVHPTLNDEHTHRVCAVVEEVMRTATRS